MTLWSGGSITAAESLSFLTISTINKCKETQAGRTPWDRRQRVSVADRLDGEGDAFILQTASCTSRCQPLGSPVCARVCRHSRLVPLPWSDACSQTQTEKQRTLTCCFSICTDTCSDPGLQRRRVPTFEGLKVKWREKKITVYSPVALWLSVHVWKHFFFLKKQTLKWSHRGRSYKNILRGIMQFRLKIMT